MLVPALLAALAAHASNPAVQSVTPGQVAPSSSVPLNFVPMSGVTAGWSSGVVRWYYNPAGEPAALAGQVVGIVSRAGNTWAGHCRVRFEYQGTTSALPRAPEGLNVIGWNADEPYSGLTLPRTSAGQLVEAGIEMNPNITNDPDFAAEVLVHELGHVLGLNHSDVQGAVMSGPPYTSYSYATRLSEDDIAGCQALYDNAGCTAPQPAPQISMVSCAPPLVGERTLRQTSACSNHVWTLNAPTTMSSNCQKVDLPPTVTPGPLRPPPTLRVKEYYRAGNDDYFLTASSEEQAILESGSLAGWTATGHSFAAWASPVSEANGVCRFIGDWHVDAVSGARIGPDTHFFTADADECAHVSERWPVWMLETDNAFYVLPVTPAGCAAGTLPVLRLFHPSDLPTHRYVTDAATAVQFAQQGWTSEGVAFCAPAA